MQDRHVPAIGAYYWLVFVVASIFGANMGDVVGQFLGWRHLESMPVLVLALIVVLIIERLDNRSSSKVWYWSAIALIPMASTNLGDFAVAWGVSRSWLVGGLIVLQIVTYFGSRSESEHLLAIRLLTRPGAAARPLTDFSYWVAMIIASTLGPVASDLFTYGLRLGAPESAAILAVLLAAVFAVDRVFDVSRPIVYWMAVILIRAAGNALGDLLAKDPRVNLGLEGSALLTGAVLLALVVLRRDGQAAGRTLLPR